MNPNVKFKADRVTPFQSRRKWLTAFAAGAGSLALAGCDRAVNNPRIDATLRSAEKLTLASQRLILDHQPLAKEYGERDLSPRFRANGSTMPESKAYADLLDAYHPQTILAYGMNGRDLPVEHGAPLRLRVERQLGYKQAKYVMRIQVVDAYATLHGGHGGFWEDRGYEWYAGI